VTQRARRGAASPLPWLGALLALYLLAPLGAFFLRLGHGAGSAPGLGEALVTSALAATVSAAIIALLGTPLAWVLAHGRSRASALLGVLVQLPLALPPLMSGILLLYVVGPYTALGRLFGGHLTDSFTGIVLAQTFVAAPFLIVAGRSAFAALDPALEDVATTLGHGPVSRFFRVGLPVALPALQAGLVLSWLRAFGEFGATVILAYHPYSLPVYTFVQFDATGLETTLIPVAAALGTAAIVLSLATLHGRLRPRPRAKLPDPRPPGRRPGAPLSFAIEQRLGSFHLELRHAAKAARLGLLGPSGAGKTVSLRVLAGLVRSPTSRILAGTEVLSDLPAEVRRVGYVPQHSALLPGRTVWQQVNFGRGSDPGTAAWWLRELELGGLEDRYPEELSGGQQRRVALARALAVEPELLLLDEPFSALDAPVRDALRRRLRRLQREAGLNTVIVTHDPEEAALLADELLLIEGGRLLQAGDRRAVFGAPASPAAAALLGILNSHRGEVAAPGRISCQGVVLVASTDGLPDGAAVGWCVAPERVRVDPAGEHEADVVDDADLGTTHELTLRLSGGPVIVAKAAHGTFEAPGARCRVTLPADAISVWPEPARGLSSSA
jgi:ABC-type sulfate/molybdate transport systems ATPase subunit/ABC-type sulfate transport system permease component